MPSFIKLKMTLSYEEGLKTIIPTILLINIIGAEVCHESISTVQRVAACPRNSTELQLAVKRKRCDALSNVQTCVSDPNKFVYHCLVNQQADGFVEVCAPEWVLAGYCGHYDTVLFKIDQNVNRDCTKFKYPCPGVFNSSESYKYQGCYEVRKKEQDSKISDEKGKVHLSTSTTINHVFWIVPTIIAIGSLIVLTYVCLKCRKAYYIADQLKEEKNRLEKSVLIETGQSKEEKHRIGENSVVTETGQSIEDNSAAEPVDDFYIESDNENQSTPIMIRIERKPSDGYTATECETSEWESSFPRRKNTPQSDEMSKRNAFRQKIERERERRHKENAASSTSRFRKCESTNQEKTTISTTGEKQMKSTLSDSNIQHPRRTPIKGRMRQSKSDADYPSQDKTEENSKIAITAQTSFETDYNTTAGEETSVYFEEEEFVTKREPIPSSADKNIRQKGNRKKRNKRNKGKTKRKWGDNIETS